MAPLFFLAFNFFLRFYVALAFLSVVLCGCSNKLILLHEKVQPPLSPICVPKRVRVALVLGSGGVRGMVHVGVLEELHEAGIPIDLIVGCSAGALVGALYADSLDINCLKKTVGSMRTRHLLDIKPWQCRYGLASGKVLANVLRQHLHAHCFHQLKIPLVIAVTDLYSGELLPIASGDLVQAIQASCAIPLIFTPCALFGRICVDGGVVSPCPTEIAKDLGAEIIIAVDLSELLHPSLPSTLLGVAARSAHILSLWHKQTSCRFADIMIRPKTSNMGTFNDKMKAQLYTFGRMAARQKIEEIRRLINNLPPLTPQDRQCRWVELTPHVPPLYKEEATYQERKNLED